MSLLPEMLHELLRLFPNVVFFLFAVTGGGQVILRCEDLPGLFINQRLTNITTEALAEILAIALAQILAAGGLPGFPGKLQDFT